MAWNYITFSVYIENWPLGQVDLFLSKHKIFFIHTNTHSKGVGLRTGDFKFLHSDTAYWVTLDSSFSLSLVCITERITKIK